MAIRPPILDDHSFDSLVEEMLARIPAHTPEWRNPRQGDPGRTLIELFAWLADTILYRANLIPERQRLVFLRLLGIQMRPAIPARGIVTLSIDEEQPTKAITIRPLARVKGPVNFETLSELTVLPVTAESYYKRKLSTDEVSELGVNLVAELQSVYQVDKAEPYITTPIFGDGLPDVTGFDLGERTVDRSLWVALLAADAAVKEQISSTIGESENGGQHVITIGIEPTVTVPELFEEIGPRATVPFVWEVTGVRTKNGKQETEYHRLDLIEDTTNGLTRRGIQRLVLPASEYIDAPTNDVRDDHRAGVGDMPPRLDDVELANRLVAWLRLRPAVGGDNDASLPGNISLSWVGINAVEIDARQTMTGRIVGQSDGSANQEIQLPGQSVDPATLVLQVESKGQGFQTWQPIDDLVFARRDELAYSLESDSGIVRIGNGLRGHLPFRGARVRVEQMRFGGGQSGNLPSGSLADITAKALDGAAVTNLKLTQDLATIGGQDAEQLVDAEQRISATLRHRERAVTGEDYQRLAFDTPAVQVSRVEVLPRFKPQQRQTGVPGVVSVMVLPAKSGNTPPNPRPDRPLLEAVHSYLDVRRPIGTELYVIGCEYHQLGISVGVNIRDGFGREEVLRNVREALRSYLWPLRPLGPNGEGWPLEHPVRDRELEVAVARVPGVSGLVDPGINLFESARRADGEPAEWRMIRRSRTHEPIEVKLDMWKLPELMSVVVVADEPPPNELRGAPNPFASESAVAVPVVPEVC